MNLTMAQALNRALREAMEQDERIVLLGEDIGALGGVFRVTDGLIEKFGLERVIDTPLNECGIAGTAVGMAMNGLRPCAEIQFADYIYPAFDQIVNELAKVRYRSGGQYTAPVVVRSPYGGGVRGGHYHSQSPEAYFVHTPGLITVIPSSPREAHGLLLSALQSDDPVIFLEPKSLYRSVREEIPDGAGPIPLQKARLVRRGGDVTLLCYGAMTPLCAQVAEQAAAAGIEAEIVDIRTLWPLDLETVLDSVRRTGRVVIVHEAARTCGYGAELAALIAERAIESLQGPILRVTGADTPVPFALEPLYMPNAGRILKAVQRLMKY